MGPRLTFSPRTFPPRRINEVLGAGNAFQNPLEWEIIGKNLFFMGVEGFAYFCLVIGLEYFFMWQPRRSQTAPDGDAGAASEQEDDVAAEAARAADAMPTSGEHALLVKTFGKVYRSRGKAKHAVNGLSFGVRPGECFGLLGVNGKALTSNPRTVAREAVHPSGRKELPCSTADAGSLRLVPCVLARAGAGKTSTFKMITGDETVTSGEAWVGGHSIREAMPAVRRSLGYTPQFDALCPLMTGRETLEMYACVRGIRPDRVQDIVNTALANLNLLRWADKPSGTYSGGNKRKLSVAIALLGNPSLLLLDEPTAGMDPAARRFLWNVILEAVAAGRSVLLTSHAMDECQALCSRLAIMVNGRFLCLGSPQHIKNKYGDGYTLILKTRGVGTADGQRRLSDMKTQVEALVPSCSLEEEHDGYVLPFHHHRDRPSYRAPAQTRITPLSKNKSLARARCAARCSTL